MFIRLLEPQLYSEQSCPVLCGTCTVAETKFLSLLIPCAVLSKQTTKIGTTIILWSPNVSFCQNLQPHLLPFHPRHTCSGPDHTVFPSTLFLFLIILHISTHFLQEAFYDLLNYNACSSVLGRLQPYVYTHVCMHIDIYIYIHMCIVHVIYMYTIIYMGVVHICIHAHTYTHTHRIGFHHCRDRLSKPRQAVKKGR